MPNEEPFLVVLNRIPWLVPAIAAYLAFAVSSLVDRFLLAGPLPNPRVYAFTAGISGIFSLFLIPFGFHFPSLLLWGAAIAGGSLNIVGLWALYRAIQTSHVSRIIPMVGAMTPLATALIVSWGTLSSSRLSAGIGRELFFLIAGTLLLSVRRGRGASRFSSRDILQSALASVCFAASVVLTKEVYVHDSFINGLIWTSIGGFLTALVFLGSSETRGVVFARATWQSKRLLVPLLGGKIVAALGAIALQLTIFLAGYEKLATITALQGVQYGAILIFVSLLAFWNPQLLKEDLTRETLLLRFLGIASVVVGIALAV
jgi:hypothetical protein